MPSFNFIFVTLIITITVTLLLLITISSCTSFVFAATFSTTILPSQQSTIYGQDTNYNNAGDVIQISGEICAGCTFQLGPNLKMGQGSSINFNSVTVNPGAKVNIVGVEVPRPTSGANSGLKIQFLSSTSFCAAGGSSATNDVTVTVSNSLIEGHARSIGRGLEFAPFSTNDCSVAQRQALPHLRVNINNSSIYGACTGGICSSDAYGFFIDSSSFSTPWRVPIQMQFENSRFEADTGVATKTGGDFNDSPIAIQVTDLPIAKLHVINSTLVATSWNSVADPVGIRAHMPQDDLTIRTGINANLDILIINNRFTLSSGGGSYRGLYFLNLTMYNRIWVLHNLFELTVREIGFYTVGSNSAATVYASDGEVPLPPAFRDGFDDATIAKYFRMIQDENNKTMSESLRKLWLIIEETDLRVRTLS